MDDSAIERAMGRIEQRAVSERKEAITAREPREWSPLAATQSDTGQAGNSREQRRAEFRPEFDSDAVAPVGQRTITGDRSMQEELVIVEHEADVYE